MSWYNNYKDEWKKIIILIEENKKTDRLIIEKDIIQSVFLYELSKLDVPFVFKGGTALSKAYGVIDRFSEDIDLSLSLKPTASEKRKIYESILKITEDLGLALTNSEAVKSRYDYNRYLFEYESLFSDEAGEIIIETSFYQIAYPSKKHTISGYVEKYYASNLDSLNVPYVLNFEMPVQTVERTFIDKVFAVCDYKIQNAIERNSRHLYDIAKIIPLISFDDSLDKLIQKVRLDRMKSKNNPSAQLEYNINETLKDIINNRFYENDYNTITSKLLYKDYSYEDAIENGIAKILNTDLFVFKEI